MKGDAKQSKHSLSALAHVACDKHVRAFMFFFWVSASLFILAAANWAFNKFIDLSTLVSSGWSIVVLFLAILFVAAFLNAVYNGVPNAREILNGILGLNTTQGVQENAVQRDSPGNGDSLQESDENQPKFDKDIELLKISLVSEEIRTAYFNFNAIYFSFMIPVAIVELGFGSQIGIIVYVGLLIILFVLGGLTILSTK